VKSTSIRRAIVPGIAALAMSLSACGGQADSTSGDSASGSVSVDGSSTVYPLSNAAAELLNEDNPDVKVTVGEAGTGGGFEVFCAGKTQISDASRPIEDDEVATCDKGGIEYQELQVANDALTVVVNKDLAVDCLTTDQLKKIWEPSAEGKVTNWNQVDPSFPDEEISLFGPGTDSGTFDYFTDAINGEEGASRSDYESSEDDNVIVQGVSGTPGAMGYFGYTYYEENTDSLKAVQIDSGNGCVEPSAETAQDGSYAPLARPLFVYVNSKDYADKPAVAAYVDFYIDQLDSIAEAAKFIPLSDDQKAETEKTLQSLQG
jgi:phosphate transport system substrate-binding protein